MPSNASVARPVTPNIISDSLLVEMLLAMPPVDIPQVRQGALKKAIIARIAAESAADGPPMAVTPIDMTGIETVRPRNGTWQKLAADIEIQVLVDDGESVSWLARFSAGATLPAHDHEGDEECLVLDGSCSLSGVFLCKGDYQIARAGSHHENLFTNEGCLLFIRSAKASRKVSVRERAVAY